MKIKLLVCTFTLALISGCAGLTPSVFSDAVMTHQNFPTLAEAVTECVADNPDAYEALKPHFNILVDKWQLANGKSMSEIAMEAVAAKRHMETIGAEWEASKQVLVDYGIDCGAGVRGMATQAEASYKTLNSAIDNSAELTYWLEMGAMISGFVVRRDGSVVRM